MYQPSVLPFIVIAAHLIQAQLLFDRFIPRSGGIFDLIDPGSFYLMGFRNTTLGNKTPAGSSDCFVIKHFPNGTTNWVTMIGGTQTELCHRSLVTLHPNGQVLWMAGWTASSFEGQSPAAGKWAVFVSQLNTTDGALHWTRFFANTSEDTSVSTAEQAAFTIFDSTTNSLYAIASRGSLVAKLSLDPLNGPPQLIWSISLGGPASFITSGTLAPGKLFVAGRVASGTFLNQTVMAGGADAFVVQINQQSGAVEASELYGGSVFEIFWQIVFDNSTNSLFLAAGTNSPVFEGAQILSSGLDIIFMRVPVSNISSPVWVKTIGSSSDDANRALEIHPRTGQVYALGIARGNVTGQPTFGGDGDIYVAVIDPFTGELNLTISGTSARDDVASAFFQPNGRLVVYGEWNSTPAILFDNSTVGLTGISTTSLTGTSTILSTSVTETLTDGDFLTAFFVIFIILILMVTGLCAWNFILVRQVRKWRRNMEEIESSPMLRKNSMFSQMRQNSLLYGGNSVYNNGSPVTQMQTERPFTTISVNDSEIQKYTSTAF